MKSCSKSGIVAGGHGTSASTLLGMLAYVSRHKPLWVCGENVANLLTGATTEELMSNFAILRSICRDVGYVR